ncbi:MAG: aminoacyl-tRNA hydrolase [Candidatus Magasanikbacteria bacterium]|jgi:peptidyl-tRNA hydrolase, PTH1 family|nr:aminoacyl-tRNA hydrolase [Candidatus Magasanikbacteria bacterium]MBT4071236.1 aminoacyl-tRNA hydrolase [Candidatus Magasanikbacteria bacterium]
MLLIIGLGNPGKSYLKTRHNVGFMILDELREALQTYDANPWELSKKFNAEISGANVKGEKIILVKPMTFMNRSGQSVGLIANYYKILPKDILVIHDDKDIQLGEYKVHTDRSAAGHNGIKSIIQYIGTQDFTRFRVGIAKHSDKKVKDTAKFVLGKFGLFEKKKLEAVTTGIITHIIDRFIAP